MVNNNPFGDDDLGLGGIGAQAIMPGEHDILGGLGVPGYPGADGRVITQQGGGGTGMPSVEDLMGANQDSLATDPYGALLRYRAGRNAGGYAPAASGVKYIFTGGSPHKPTIYDRLAETALVIGALRARSAEKKRQAEREKAKKDLQVGGEG